MKKITFIAAALMLLFAVPVAQAQTVASVNDTIDFSTESSTNWQVAKILTYNQNGVTSGSTPAHENYWTYANDAFESNFSYSNFALNSNGTSPSNSTTKHNILNYQDAVTIAAGSLSSQHGAANQANWITTPDANLAGVDYNGYYAYQYTFDWDILNTENLSNLFVNVDFTAGSDDHLHAVYLNGVKLWEGDHNNLATTENWQTGTFVGASLLLKTALEDYSLTSEDNTITFIVHNDGHYGQAGGHYSGQNATGFAVDGSFNLSATRKYDEFGNEIPETPPTTPEPATLLILGLGAIGAGVYRRRIQK